jgi:hypothetical protein
MQQQLTPPRLSLRRRHRTITNGRPTDPAVLHHGRAINVRQRIRAFVAGARHDEVVLFAAAARPSVIDLPPLPPVFDREFERDASLLRVAPMTQTIADAVSDMDQHAHAILSTLNGCEIENSLACMGYAMSLLLHGIEPEHRLEAARTWVIVLLNNVHRGIEEQTDATKH